MIYIYISCIVAAVVVIGFVAWRPLVSSVEQAKYTVVVKQGSIEIRDYEPMIVAETEVEGQRQEAISDARNYSKTHLTPPLGIR